MRLVHLEDSLSDPMEFVTTRLEFVLDRTRTVRMLSRLGDFAVEKGI